MQFIPITNPNSITNPILGSPKPTCGYGGPWIWQADPIKQAMHTQSYLNMLHLMSTYS